MKSKKTVVFLLLFIICVVLCACGDNNGTKTEHEADPKILVDEKLQGNWKVDVSDKVSAIYSFENGHVSVTTIALGIALEPQEATYKINDSTILLSYDDDNEVSLEYTFEENILTIYFNEESKLEPYEIDMSIEYFDEQKVPKPEKLKLLKTGLEEQTELSNSYYYALSDDEEESLDMFEEYIDYVEENGIEVEEGERVMGGATYVLSIEGEVVAFVGISPGAIFDGKYAMSVNLFNE